MRPVVKEAESYTSSAFIDETGKEVITDLIITREVMGNEYPQAVVMGWLPMDCFYEGLAPVLVWFFATYYDGVSLQRGLIERMCYIDKTGNIVIATDYEQTIQGNCFSEGLALVKGEGGIGYIDKQGNEVIPCQYDFAWSFHEGLARVIRGNKWGFIDKTGKEVVPLIYDTVFDFHEGLAHVSIGVKNGFIDRQGNIVIPMEYGGASDFNEGVAWVTKDGLSGVIKNPLDRLIKVSIDGEFVYFDQPPILDNSRVFVPMRAIFQALGADVVWDAKTQTITATKCGDTVVMTIGSKIMRKNGQEVALSVAPVVVSSRTMVPARAVAEAFDAEVTWNAEQKTVYVKTKPYSLALRQ